MWHIQPMVALGFYMLILLLAHFGFDEALLAETT